MLYKFEVKELNNLSFIFSIVFLAAFVVYSAFGGFIIHLNPKERMNRLFLLLCVFLGVWSLGFSVSTSAADIQTSILWQRIAAIGWGCFFSVLLHFVMLLTNQKNILRRFWSYILIYAPAAFNMYIFTMPNPLNQEQYHMVQTSFGWVNTSGNWWHMYFNIYYIVFLAVGFVLIWKWGKGSHENKKQAKMFLVSMLAAVAIVTVTDSQLSPYISLLIPQLAPIVAIIPLMTVNYVVRQYGFLNTRPSNLNEQILNRAARTRVYNYISIAYLIGSVVYVLAGYFIYNVSNMSPVFLFSFFVLCFGLAIQIVRRLKIKNDYKDIVNTIIIAISIPVITLNFIQTASLTIWAFPIIVIIFALVFNRRFVLYALSLSIIATQILVWLLVPYEVVSVDILDHITRIGIFGVALIMAFYVNRIYILRLKDNSEQVCLQKLISEISSDFVTVNESNLEVKICSALQKSGSYFQMDRAYVVRFNHEKNTITYRYEWCNEGIPSDIGSFYETPAGNYPWLTEKMRSNETVLITDFQKLPKEAQTEMRSILSRGIQSLITLPIRSNDRLLGFLGFNSITNKRTWREEHLVFLGVISNILSDAFTKVEAEKEITNMAYFDHLTKLPNRLMFNDRVDQAISLAQRTNKMVGIMFLDLDSFKNVNDTMGHQGGDELLKTISQVLHQNVRKSDTVSRFGGDEFLIMLNQVDHAKDILKVADHIMSLFNKPFKISQQEFFVTCSAGIAVYPMDGDSTQTLIKNADIAMYSAKAKGKNQYILCTEDMKEEIQRKMKITNFLYHAQEKDELMVYYQPQVSLLSGEIIGLEALLRWKHPEMGMIPPATFIPLSEQTGLTNSIGEWVLMTACGQNKKWQDLGLPQLRMAVNVSVNQLRNPNLVRQVKSVLSETYLNPMYLELEITESVAINESNYIIEVLNKLKDIGVSISIDDFGTEYSSLSRLKTLPIDRLKMDMQFVQGIDASAKDQAITKVIINLAKNLGIKVIAEGVETENQLDFLSQKMCDEVQGFYYYKPMPANELEPLLRKGKLSVAAR